MFKLISLLCLAVAVHSAVVPKDFGQTGDVVFIGDSITDWWRNDGKVVWDEYYGPKGAVDVGVAGDVTQQTIDRIVGGSLDNLRSRVAVLLIGTNDLARNLSEDYVSDQIGRILSMIQAYLPNSKVILLGILPRGGADIHQRARNVNNKIRNYHNGNTVHYLDMDAQFSPGLGQVYQNLYWGDQLHLSTDGYRVWAQTMNNLFNALYYR